MNPIIIFGAVGVAGYFLYTSYQKKLDALKKELQNKIDAGDQRTFDDATNYTDETNKGNEEIKKAQTYCYPTTFKLSVRADVDAYWAYMLEVTFENKLNATYYITNIQVRNVNIGGKIVDGIFMSQPNKQFAIRGKTTITISKQITALLFDTKEERSSVKNSVDRYSSKTCYGVVDWDFASVGNEIDPNVEAKEVTGTFYRGPATGDYGTISKTWIKNGKIE